MTTSQAVTGGLSRQQHLLIAALIWTVVGVGLFTMGLLFWFHLPYLGNLDPKHLAIGALMIGIGLAKGKFVLDKTANRVIERTNSLQEPNPAKSIFQMFGVKTIALVGSMMFIGYILRATGVSYEIRGLVYLAVGPALLLSSRNYWMSAFKPADTEISA
ncbi:hypothetical protein IQ266_00310 [filamentous cyanobacterium LEGE 11480]|uniref:Uncharacterized protein n=1 Tax=Romeriopsis navalis LEGE 11480 TaxID=2777977 RepID=A0A928VKG9_9CYAN|nr:hypothetical protein [Romeriopsis navalis]MBE9028195.1 hypothetical protein [Romeriopsis navalis LEGE 11480]